MLEARWGGSMLGVCCGESVLEASEGRSMVEACWRLIVGRDSCRGVSQDGTGTRLVTGGGQVIVGQRGVCVEHEHSVLEPTGGGGE